MSQELITREAQQAQAFPRSATVGAGANVGAIAIEQERAIAEAQGQLILAKKFPRDENAAFADLMKACKMGAFAAVAFYNVPRAGGSVSGPSIRLAEEIARCYGNFQYGHRELARDGAKSEVEVYAWDMEKNNYSKRQITVLHVLDTKNGPRPLRDQKDIDDKIANVASKQVRGRILALLPKWLVEEAVQECRKTIAGNNDEPIEARVRKMTQAFAKFGVTTSHLERFLGHTLAETLSDEIVDLQGIYNSIKEGTAPSEFFHAEQQADENEKTAAAIADAAKPAGDAPAAGPAAARAPRQRQQKPAAEKPAQQQQQQSEPETGNSNPVQQESTTVEEPAPEVTESQSEPAATGGAEPQSQGAAGAAQDDDVF